MVKRAARFKLPARPRHGYASSDNIRQSETISDLI